MADPKEYDLIIVGAGMAGIIAAARIAEKGINPRTGDRLRIAMIEAGPHLMKGERKAGYGHPNRRQMIPQMQWEEFAMLDNWPWSFGLKVVGGCSIHWGAHLFLPFDFDYDNWSAMGVDWTKANMKEAIDDVVAGLHIHADPDEAFQKGERMFLEAARSMGYEPHPHLTSRKNCIYCGFISFGHGCKYDAKGSSLWYLPIAEANGVELIDRAEVKKVIIEKQGAGGIVKGVYYEKDGQVQEARAEKVVVSCGTNGTPVLLAKSGYGPREELGSNLIVENRNVGQNLDGDTSYQIPILFNEPIKEAGRGTTGNLDFLVYDSNYKDGTGVLEIATSGFTNITYPHVAAMVEFAPAFGKAHKDFMKTAVTRLGTFSVWMHRAPTYVKGRVNLSTGADVYPGDPYIDQRMQTGREIAMEIGKKMGVKISSQFPKTFKGRGGSHAGGTCRAGGDRRNSVINQNFESHEVKGLFAVDPSALPRAAMYSGFYAAFMAAFAARRIVANHFSRGVGG